RGQGQGGVWGGQGGGEGRVRGGRRGGRVRFARRRRWGDPDPRASGAEAQSCDNCHPRPPRAHSQTSLTQDFRLRFQYMQVSSHCHTSGELQIGTRCLLRSVHVWDPRCRPKCQPGSTPPTYLAPNASNDLKTVEMGIADLWAQACEPGACTSTQPLPWRKHRSFANNWRRQTWESTPRRRSARRKNEAPGGKRPATSGSQGESC